MTGDRSACSAIAAFENGIALYHPKSAALQWISQPAAAHPHLRFNDGRVDRQGRFLTGTRSKRNPATADATLYCVTADGATTERERGLRITNGICSSPDGRRLYLADSPRAIIYCHDLDPDSGALSHRRVFARTTGGAPDGKIDQVLEVPVSQPTCVAFGGSDRDLLFASSAREGLSAAQLAEQPHSGDVLVYRVKFRGLPEPRFRGDLRTSKRAAFA